MSKLFDQVVQIMATLRGEGGCPWDRKQTHESLKPHLIEETYEVLETIDLQDHHRLKEELGDVLLQVLFHAQIGSERNTFTIDDVLETLADKLTRRHPHVFGERPVSDAAEALHRWEEIKRQEKAEKAVNGDAGSALADVPKSLPALLRAYQLQVRAARVGFDWPEGDSGRHQIVEKIQEELAEIEEARLGAATSADERAQYRLQEEVGDLLFAAVNFARNLKINPEEALRTAANRFAERFMYMEHAAKQSGRGLAEMSPGEQNILWEQAKAAEQKRSEA
jgi:tetrapyrrole methylase family protein/MazG family protein